VLLLLLLVPQALSGAAAGRDRVVAPARGAVAAPVP
jgi:hypothetical protein